MLPRLYNFSNQFFFLSLYQFCVCLSVYLPVFLQANVSLCANVTGVPFRLDVGVGGRVSEDVIVNARL